MKQPKPMTREQKIILGERGLDAGQFSLTGETEKTLVLLDKANGIEVTIPKEVKGKGSTPWLFVKPER